MRYNWGNDCYDVNMVMIDSTVCDCGNVWYVMIMVTIDVVCDCGIMMHHTNDWYGVRLWYRQCDCITIGMV